MTKLLCGLCFSLLVLSQQIMAKPLENGIKESPDKIGDLLVLALETGDYAALDERFDQHAFADKLIKVMNPAKNDAELIRKKIIELINLEMIFKNALGGVASESITARMVSVANKNNSPVPIVRLNLAEGGSNYYELSLYKKNGKYFIDDIFIIASAQFMSESMGQAMAVLFNQSSGWFSKINIKNNEMKSLSDIFSEIMEHKKNGDIEATYRSFKKLPEYITDNDTIHLAIVMAAINLDESVYRNELSAFAKKHGNNPRYTFMLIDHYLFIEDYNQALKNIDLLLLRYQNDASLTTMKANVYLLQEDYKNAQSELVSAVGYEPDFEDAYWTGVTAALADKEYQIAVEWLKNYENQFAFEFTEESFQDQEIYKSFIKSRAFKRWMKSKQA